MEPGNPPLPPLSYVVCSRLFDAAPDKATVAEELADDVQKMGEFVAVCMQPKPSAAAVHLAATALHHEIDETEQRKLKEMRET